LAIPVGAAAGLGNPAVGYSTAYGVKNRGYLGAESQRLKNLTGAQQQLEAERADYPLYKDESEAGWRNFQAGLDVARENREREYGESRIGALNEKNEALKQHYEDLQDKYSQPKAENPKNADEALSAASSAKDPDEKARLIKLAGEMHKNEMSKVYAEHPNAGAENWPSAKQNFDFPMVRARVSDVDLVIPAIVRTRQQSIANARYSYCLQTTQSAVRGIHRGALRARR
jgi:hypothetical protein